MLETILRKSSTAVKHSLIKELCDPPSFISIVNHKYGNYVVQRAITVAPPELRASLVTLATTHAAKLKLSNVGRRVLKLIAVNARVVAPKHGSKASSREPQQERSKTSSHKTPSRKTGRGQTKGAQKNDAAEKGVEEPSGWDV